MVGKIEGRGEDSVEDEMAGQHHQCNEHELEQTSGDGKGQGRLASCSPWGRKELDTTGQLSMDSARALKMSREYTDTFQ